MFLNGQARKLGGLLLLGAWLFSFWGISGEQSTNGNSRLAAIDSLIHRHTFYIEKSVYSSTIDKAQLRNGHFVSEKLPLLTVIGAGVYSAYFHLTGQSFSLHEALVIRVLGTFLSWIPLGLIFLFFGLILNGLNVSDRGFFWGVLAMAGGFLGVGYGTQINSHLPAAAALLIAFYAAIKVRISEKESKPFAFWAFTVGYFSAMAVNFDLPAVFVGLGVIFYAAQTRAKLLLPIILGGLAPLLLHFYLNHLATGYWLSLYFHLDRIFYPGSFWGSPVGIDARVDSRLVYLINILVGIKGQLAISPVLIFSLLGLGEVLGRKNHPLRNAALFVGLTFVALLSFFTLFANNKYGGVCVGFRFMIPFLPFLFLFISVYFSERRSILTQIVFFLCLIVSAIHMHQAWQNPWQASHWEKFLMNQNVFATFHNPS